METVDLSVRDLHTKAIDAACDLLEEGDYAAVYRIIRGTLPTLAETAYEERIRIYMLLLALPDSSLNQNLHDDSLRTARHIIQHRDQFSQRYRLCAHMIFGSFRGEWTADSEKNEHFAVQDAQKVLVNPDASREDRDMALTIIASQSPDHDQIRLCIEELLNGANAFAMTQAVTSAPVAFHRETNFKYLDDALDQVKGPSAFIADILRKKMLTTLRMLEEDTEAGTLNRKDIHTKLVMCYANLRMLPGALVQQAWSEYYLAYAAAYMDETETGLIHAYTAIGMARRLGLAQLEQLASAVRDHLRSRAPYEGEENAEEDEE